jgi:hypothetical protein
VCHCRKVFFLNVKLAILFDALFYTLYFLGSYGTYIIFKVLLSRFFLISDLIKPWIFLALVLSISVSVVGFLTTNTALLMKREYQSLSSYKTYWYFSCYSYFYLKSTNWWLMEPGGSTPNSLCSLSIPFLSRISLVHRINTLFKIHSNIFLPYIPRPS